MSLHQQQNFLAKLYTNAELRRDFLSEPNIIGAENNLNEQEIAEIAEIMPEDLNFFADSLFWKRLREVEKFLPITQRVLGEDFTTLFREFAQSYNPQTVKKHLEDSFEFSKYLQKQEVSEFVKNVLKFEQSKLLFFGYGRRFVFCKLDFDIRKINHKDTETLGLNLKKRKTIAVWSRIGRKTKHFFI